MGRKPKCSSCDEYRWGVCFGDREICKDYIRYKPSERYQSPLVVEYRKIEKKIEVLACKIRIGSSMGYQLGILRGLRIALGYSPKSKLSENAKVYVKMTKEDIKGH